MARSARTDIVFDFSGDEDLIATQLRKIVDKTTTIELKKLEKLKASVLRERASETANNNKLAKRSDIYARAKERLYAKELEYERARIRARVAKEKLMTRSTKSSRSRDLARQYEDQVHQITRRISRAEEVYSGDAFEKKALMLRFILPSINTNIPIEYSTSEEELTLTWQTNDIFIKDGFGGWLRTNFGKFDIKISYYRRNGLSNSVEVYCNHVQGAGLRIDDQYWHPHLNHDGHACLGNIAPRLMTAMSDLDISLVIEEITEFLQHYNKDNPYRKLELWCANRWDNAVCETNQHLMMGCECTRCNTCGSIFEEEDLSECGHCHSCCIVNHVNTPVLSNGIRISGINGSSCLTRREYNLRMSSAENEQETTTGGPE